MLPKPVSTISGQEQSGVRQSMPDYMQWRRQIVAAAPEANPIRVRLANDVATSVIAGAVRDGLTQWNNLAGSRARFVEVASGQQITIQLEAGDCTEVGHASWPSAVGAPGPNVWLRLQGCGPLMTYGDWVSATTHELGHAIGFRHTDWAEHGEQGCDWVWSEWRNDCAGHLAGTPTGAEVASIMHHQLTGPNKPFSANDRAAIRTVFPSTGPTASVAATLFAHDISWPAVAGAVSYDVFLISYTPNFYGSGFYWTTSSSLLGSTSGTTFTSTAAMGWTSVPCVDGTNGYVVRVQYAEGPPGLTGARACVGFGF